MSGPYIASHPVSFAWEMVIALGVGLGFGFSLERAGFGRADNLAAIFYGRDFRVLRVMFTAIATAAVGLYLLDGTGVLPLERLGLLETFWAPQLVGGVLLGMGFILGGYCPGTGLVAAASGKTDALFFLGGLVLGTFAFSLTQPWTELFQLQGSLGFLLLPDALHIPRWAGAALVLLLALGAFRLAGWVERRVNAA